MENKRGKIDSDCKVISIIQGEEYKEKLECEIRKNNFFYESYNEANSILHSIIKQQDEEENAYHQIGNNYDMHMRENDRFIDRMHINNIITFNADRGQGKTSALYTFAQYLNNCCSTEDVYLKGSFDEKIKNEFEILPIIDPTELNGGESIIRIFVAQLFKVYQDISENLQTDMDMKLKRYDIVELFQRCYDNINYIQGKRDNTEWTNDLENLMKLGNVSEIKRNLKRLIDKVLLLQSIKSPEKKHKKLVVRIDDTDLCMCDAFSICEDIREYLSLPNVVILMALDIRQLKYSIFQRYLMKYEGILKFDNDYYYKKSVLEKCDYMASRYIEKMFPSGYVVDLPRIDELVKKNYSNIKVDYKLRKNDELLPVETNNAYKESKDLHEQLLNLLYAKTGIIINRKKDKVHFILPVSMRELNHFLRLLSDMKPVDFNELYAIQDGTSLIDADDIEERVRVQKENLIDNLHRLKRYYLNYCNPNRLGEELSSEFIRIADSEDVYYNLGELIKRELVTDEKDERKWGYSDIVHFLYKQSHSLLLTESIEIFLDIILHETLLSTLNEKDERKKFSSQFRYVIDWKEENNVIKKTNRERENKSYKCLEFELEKYDFKDIFYTDENTKEMFSIPVKTNINTFCYALNAGGDEVDLMESDEKNSYINENAELVKFSILKAFDGFFNLTSSGFSSDDNNFTIRLYDLYMNVAITLDVIQTIDLFYQAYKKRVDFGKWEDIVSDMYTNIDKNINDHFDYLQLNYKIGNEINRMFIEENRLKQLFLRDKNNGVNVVSAYKRKIGQLQSKAYNLIENFKNIQYIGHNENMSNVYSLNELSKQFRSTHPFVEAVGTKRNSYEGEIEALEKKKEKLWEIFVQFIKSVDPSSDDQTRAADITEDKSIDDYIEEIKAIKLDNEYGNNNNSSRRKSRNGNKKRKEQKH